VFRDSLLLADPIAARIAVLDAEGRVGRVINVPLAKVDQSRAWGVLRREMEVREALRDRRNWDIPRVDEIPRMAAMLTDASDRIWIKEYDPVEDAHWLGGWAGGEGGNWHVLDADGQRLGTVTMPRRLVPLFIGKDLVLGRYRDELDIQFLAVHRIHFASPARAPRLLVH
jgi:hypothetical protein